MDFFPVDWRSGDHEGAFRVTACGKTAEGVEVCVHAAFTPYFFVQVPREWSDARVRAFAAETCMKHGGVMGRCVPVKRKSAWGFTAGESQTMVQLAFPTLGAMRRARSAMARAKTQTYEATVDPLVRVFHLRDLSPAGWIRVSGHAPVARKTSRCDLEIETSFESLAPSPPDVAARQPPLVVGSWDIECYSATGAFPVAERPEDAAIQIATTFQRYGEPEPYARTVVCLHDTAPVDGAEIVSCADEAAVFNAWAGLLRRERCDVLVDWNGAQFDMKYLHGRSFACIDDATGDTRFDLGALGRMVEGGGEPLERELNSSAYGQNKFFELATPGVMHLDLLQWFRKNRSLDSYSLQNVSTLYLGDQKLDLPAHEIFRKFKGSAADRADIARYAVKDTELPLRLAEKMAILPDLFEMANAVKIPVAYVNNRGQQVRRPRHKHCHQQPCQKLCIALHFSHRLQCLQIRVYSALVGKARQLGYAIPDDKAIPAAGKFEGATVLEPKKGAYFEPVAALDFASLYPSILRQVGCESVGMFLKKSFRWWFCTRRPPPT